METRKEADVEDQRDTLRSLSVLSTHEKAKKRKKAGTKQASWSLS